MPSNTIIATIKVPAHWTNVLTIYSSHLMLEMTVGCEDRCDHPTPETRKPKLLGLKAGAPSGMEAESNRQCDPIL